MFENKYSNFLTVLLVIVIIAIIGCLAFGGYKVYQQFNSTKDATDYVNSFIQNVTNNTNSTIIAPNTTKNNNTTTESGDNNVLNQLETTPGGTSGGTTSGNVQTYKGYTVIGTIEIPKTKVSYPILKTAGPTELDISVGMLYGAGPNKAGNTLIIGHNWRNGQFFANNKNLSIGDKIYITDLSGQRLSYTIYDKFETTTEDTEHITRNTNGAREISLQTCTDDGSMRLIILAKCDLDS